MKNLNSKLFIWIVVGVSVAIWAIILQITGVKIEGFWDAVKNLPTVVSIDSLLFLFFAKWGWRFKVFQGWLVPFPVLEGTWEGTIESIWINPKSRKRIGPLKTYLVIKQSFIHTSCVMFTEEMTSRSNAAEFSIDPESNSRKIIYTYTSRPNAIVRERSVVHDGTAVLEIITSPKRTLNGEYWTNRMTTGQIKLKFKKQKLLESFPETRVKSRK